MLLNNSQVRRLTEAFPKGSRMLVGPIPDANRQKEGMYHWSPEHMNSMAGKVCDVYRVRVIESYVMADGTVKYEVSIALTDGRNSGEFMPEWVADSRVLEILDSPKIKIPMTLINEKLTANKTVAATAQARPQVQTKTDENEGAGLFGAFGGAIVAALGTAFINRRKEKQETKKQPAVIVEKEPEPVAVGIENRA